jgi:hypothetical protein
MTAEDAVTALCHVGHEIDADDGFRVVCDEIKGRSQLVTLFHRKERIDSAWFELIPADRTVH